MASNDSYLKLSISPQVPHNIIEKTFEGALIRRLISVSRTHGGYELWSGDGVSPALVNVEDLRNYALASDSRLATAILPLLDIAIEANELVPLEDISAALYQDSFDIVDVLQELCKMYPEEFSHFEVLWAEVSPKTVPDFGRLGGGADFVTADAIESVNAKTWLEQRRMRHNRPDLAASSDLPKP